MEIAKVLTALCYLLGLLASVVSLVWLLIAVIAKIFAKANKKESSFSIKKPIILFLISLVLLFGPSILIVTAPTLFGGANTQLPPNAVSPTNTINTPTNSY